MQGLSSRKNAAREGGLSLTAMSATQHCIVLFRDKYPQQEIMLYPCAPAIVQPYADL